MGWEGEGDEFQGGSFVNVLAFRKAGWVIKLVERGVSWLAMGEL